MFDIISQDTREFCTMTKENKLKIISESKFKAYLINHTTKFIANIINKPTVDTSEDTTKIV